MKSVNLKNMEPLTEEERAFSADLENYNQFFKYMKINQLNQEEWYDILILHYLRAVKKYLNIPHLQQYEFGTVLFKTLDSAMSNHFKAMNTQKRKPEGGVYSYNALLKDDNTDNTFEKYIVDVYTNVERQVIFKELFKEFYEKCINCNPLIETDIYKDELDMMLKGYCFKKILNATLKKYGGCDDDGFYTWSLENDMKKFRKIFQQVFGI